MRDPLETAPPELVVDMLAPTDGTFGDADYAAFIDTLDSIRDANEWWLVLTDHGVAWWAESAEVY